MILWKCRAGHRDERRYCDLHIADMTQVAHRVLAGDWKGIPLCAVCLAPILPVLEGGGGLTAAGHARVCWPLPGWDGPCPACGWEPVTGPVPGWP
jgi:hypothetical protein